MIRGERLALAAILSLAAALRIFACDHWSEDLSRDPDAYRALAERLAAGDGYVSPNGAPTAFRPPLYPLLLTGVLWSGSTGLAALQILFGVATVALTASLGRRLGLGRWCLFAALLVALDPLLLRYTPQAMTEVTCAFLATLLLWIAAASSPSSGENRETKGTTGLSSHRSFFVPLALGLTFGFAALSRPTFWPFGALVAVTWIWQQINSWRQGDGSPSRQARRRAVFVLLGTFLVVAPWAFRNTFSLGRPVLTTTHGGYTLLLANNPVYWEEVVEGPPEAVWRGNSLDAWQKSLEARQAADGVPRNEIAIDRWMRSVAFENIRQAPTRFLRAVVYRLGRFWSMTPAAEGVPTVVRWGLGAYYAVVYGLALVGGLRLAVGRERAARRDTPHAPFGSAPWLPLLLLIAAFVAVHAVYWTDTRMRAPLVPAVALLAALGASTGSRRWLARLGTPRT